MTTDYYDAQFWATLFAVTCCLFAAGAVLVAMYKETKR